MGKHGREGILLCRGPAGDGQCYYHGECTCCPFSTCSQEKDTLIFVLDFSKMCEGWNSSTCHCRSSNSLPMFLQLAGLALYAESVWVTADPYKVYPIMGVSGKDDVYAGAWISIFTGFAFFCVCVFGIISLVRGNRLMVLLVSRTHEKPPCRKLGHQSASWLVLSFLAGISFLQCPPESFSLLSGDGTSVIMSLDRLLFISCVITVAGDNGKLKM